MSFRSSTRTGAWGAAIGIASAAVFIAAIWVLGGFSGYAIFLFILAGQYGLPIAIVVGAVCALLSFRRRAWSLRRALWIVPLITIPVTMLLGTAAAMGAKALQEKLEAAHLMKTATANYSGHWIRNVQVLDPDCQWGLAKGEDLSPQEPDASNRLKIERDGHVTLDWASRRTLELSWIRPLHGSGFDEKNLDAPTALVHAAAALPPYRGTMGKVFVIIFLPDDKVRVEAVAASGTDIEVGKPVYDQYVTQGTAQKCAEFCCYRYQ
jgi:hypothetical protein